VREGNAAVLSVVLEMLDVGERDAPDFKAALRRLPPERVPWRSVPTRYVGHDASFAGWWQAEAPMLPGRDYAWRVAVRTRAGDVATTHHLPVIPVRTFGDPAGPPRLP